MASCPPWGLLIFRKVAVRKKDKALEEFDLSLVVLIPILNGARLDNV